MFIPREEDIFYKVGKAKAFFQPEGYPWAFDLGNLESLSLSYEPDVTDYGTNEDSDPSPALSIANTATATIAFVSRSGNKISDMLSFMSEETKFEQEAGAAVPYAVVGVPYKGLGIDFERFNVTGATLKIDVSGAGPAIPLVVGTHLKLDGDGGLAKLVALPDGFDEDTATGISGTFAHGVYTAPSYDGFSQSNGFRGKLVLRDTNQRGPKKKHTFYTIEVRPDGDQGYLSDSDLSTKSFSGKIYKNANAPGNGFFNVTNLPNE